MLMKKQERFKVKIYSFHWNLDSTILKQFIVLYHCQARKNAEFA
jgi:hypothetical protein